MHVMLDIFSGRPNPTWEVPPTVARHVRSLSARQGGPASAGPRPALGYRGLLVATGPEDAEVPMAFHIGGPPPVTKAAIETVTPPHVVPHDEREAALTLLESARPVIERKVIDAAAQAVEARPEAVLHAARATAAEAAEIAPVSVDAPCEPILAPYRPWFWNADPIRLRNNCYNYASNYVSNFVAQPGRRTGHFYDAFTCEGIAKAAIADGYREECDGPARVVALAVWPGYDFHWYRSHGDFWAHKLGIYSARNVDNLGRVITGPLTPATCDRGPYIQFCRYMFVPPGVEVL